MPPCPSDLYMPPCLSDLSPLPHAADTTRAHICRAALEAVALQAREVLTAMEADSKVRLSALQVDGGMTVNELLMQLQADAIQVPVRRPSGPDPSEICV